MMFTSDLGLFKLRPDGSFFGALKDPVQCGCGVMAAFVINRDGKTRCVECDGKYQAEPRLASFNTSTGPDSDQLVHYKGSAARYGSGWKTKPRSGP